MKFRQRLLLYLFGVGLGLMLVYVFFKDRDVSSWLPQNRVKDQILAGEIQYNSTGTCQKKCLNLSEGWMESYLPEADVDFSKSETRKKPCPHYHITGKFNELDLQVWIELCDTTSTVMEISDKNSPCSCD